MCCYSYSSYDSFPAGRPHRRSKGGFRMNHARLYCRGVRVRLLKVVRFLIRRFESMRKRLSGTCAGGGVDSGRKCDRSSSGRSLMPPEDRQYESHQDYTHGYSYKMRHYGRSPFYAEAIADCLEFIKRSSGPVPLIED